MPRKGRTATATGTYPQDIRDLSRYLRCPACGLEYKADQKRRRNTPRSHQTCPRCRVTSPFRGYIADLEPQAPPPEQDPTPTTPPGAAGGPRPSPRQGAAERDRPAAPAAPEETPPAAPSGAPRRRETVTTAELVSRALRGAGRRA